MTDYTIAYPYQNILVIHFVVIMFYNHKICFSLINVLPLVLFHSTSNHNDFLGMEIKTCIKAPPIRVQCYAFMEIFSTVLPYILSKEFREKQKYLCERIFHCCCTYHHVGLASLYNQSLSMYTISPSLYGHI